MPNNLREELINQLSELSLSLSDSLERVGEADLESNRSTGAGKKAAAEQSGKSQSQQDTRSSQSPADAV